MDDEDVRLAVYRGFATTGRAPSPTDETRAGLRRLAAARHVVLDDDGNVVMAHPFSSVALGFAVMGARTLWWGGCAWDSFAVPHLVPDEPEVLVSTRCPGCGTAHAWVVARDEPPAGPQVAHFLVPRLACGTTWCTRAATSACSAGRLASTHGWQRPATPVAT